MDTLRRFLLPIALLLGALVLLSIWFAGITPDRHELGFALDDAWIHMTYARNLLSYPFLAFNPGIPATGATSPLWVFSLAIIHFLFAGQSVTTLIKAVLIWGGILQLMAIVLVWDITKQLTQQTKVAFVAALLMAFCTGLSGAAITGMEVALTSVMLLATLSCWLRRWWLLAGLMLALAAITRPEAAMTWLVYAGIICFSCYAAQTWRARLWVLAKFTFFSFAIGIIWFTYNYVVSRHFLPATFYLKQVSSLSEIPYRLYRGIFVITFIPPFAFGSGLLMFLGYIRAKPIIVSKLTYLLPLLLGVSYLLTVNYVLPPGVYSFYCTRYIMPPLSLLTIASTIGGYELSRQFCHGKLSLLWVFLGVSLLTALVSIYPISEGLHEEISLLNHIQVKMSRWLAKHAPANTWVGGSDVGALGYFSKHNVVDIIGLNTPDFVWHHQTFIRQHPVSAFTLLVPLWYKLPQDSAAKRIVILKSMSVSKTLVPRYTDKHYQQLVLSCNGPKGKPELLHLAKNTTTDFVFDFSIYCIPWQHDKYYNN